MKRKYEKKSSYWEQRKISTASAPVSLQQLQAITPQAVPNIQFSMSSADEETEVSYASRASGERSGETGMFSRYLYRTKAPYQFSQITQLPLPYDYNNDGSVDVKEAIELVTRAYTNIGIVKNSIDIMSEIANTSYELSGGTEKSKRFVGMWLKKIDIDSLKEQFFLELFRSGNIFFYKLTGNWNGISFANHFTDNISLATPAKLPLKYVLMNPAEIVKEDSIISDYVFSQRFSIYELNRINNPKTDKEREVYNSIKSKAKDLDKTGILLEDDLIAFAFYNKLDYEPFAIPFVWPILRDLNLKLEMKRRDEQVLRLINHAILLITNGNEPEKGGVNPANILAIQRLFEKEAVGRVAVMDYTSKGEFLIPDLKKIIYPEKYAIINEDIKEGLSNILFGTDAKYGNLVVKVQVFLQKMQKARRCFEKMMQREINIACQYMGIINPPEIKMNRESLEDPALLHKTAIRLLEVGAITPEEAMPFIKNREFPDMSKSLDNQKTHLKNKEDGLYMPTVGGQPLYDNGIGPFAPKPTPNAKGRPKEKGMASLQYIKDAALEKQSLVSALAQRFKASEAEMPAMEDIANRVLKSVHYSKASLEVDKIFDKPEIINDYAAHVDVIAIAMRTGSTIEEATLLKVASDIEEDKTSQSQELV